MLFDIGKFISSFGTIGILFFVVVFWNYKKGTLLKSGKLNKKDNPLVFHGLNILFIILGIIFLLLGILDATT